MSQLFRLNNTQPRDPAIDAWFRAPPSELKELAKPWFDWMRKCGGDVREAMHDGCPTACVGDVAFAYVAAYKAHVNVGFFRGALLDDPDGLLKGTGKMLRHVKMVPGANVDTAALVTLIEAAYKDVHLVVRTHHGPGNNP